MVWARWGPPHTHVHTHTLSHAYTHKSQARRTDSSAPGTGLGTGGKKGKVHCLCEFLGLAGEDPEARGGAALPGRYHPLVHLTPQPEGSTSAFAFQHHHLGTRELHVTPGLWATFLPERSALSTMRDSLQVLYGR